MANLNDSKGDLEQLSGVERYKAQSGGLYGPIADEIAAGGDSFADESVQLLKHHGMYQADDRDVRRERKKQGLDKLYTMMVRTKFPGGILTAEQYLFCDAFATKYGHDDIRATSRQDFQISGIVKANLRPLINDLNRLANISTLGGCGDVVRNTMANPVADIDPAYTNFGTNLIALAQRISDATLPKSKAYYDLWLNDEKVTVNEDGTARFASDLREHTTDTLYGDLYLPRKFKIGIGTDFDNSVDVYTHDIGIIAVTENGKISGYEVLVGGGLGYSHRKRNTYARAGTPFAFVQEDELLPLIKAILAVQRDYGERTIRKQARLKYTIDRMGEADFHSLVSGYAGWSFPAPRGVKPTAQPDYLGWHKQIQKGLNYVGVWVESGRIKDFEGGFQYKAGLRTLIDRFRPSIRVTPHNNIILANIRDEDIEAVQALLDDFGLPTDKRVSKLRRMEMACPALPLCPLALSEAERQMPSLMQGLEEAGYADADVCIRITGCPNGCARSQSAEIGLVGKGPGRYVLHTGGDYNGTRLNELLIPVVMVDDVVPTIAQLLGMWQAQRQEDEQFGDWSHRLGVVQLRKQLGVPEPVEPVDPTKIIGGE